MQKSKLATSISLIFLALLFVTTSALSADLKKTTPTLKKVAPSSKQMPNMIKVTRPAKGEYIRMSKTLISASGRTIKRPISPQITVKWESFGEVSNLVRIFLLSKESRRRLLLMDYTANDGHEEITLTSDQSREGFYAVRVQDKANSKIFDESETFWMGHNPRAH